MSSKLSIIIPCHNNVNEIERALVSCTAQLKINIEVIVVDNGSNPNDNTEKIVRSFNDNRIIYESLKEGNRSRARNVGLKKATGNYIQFLDADDYLDPLKGYTSCSFLDKHLEDFAFMTATAFVNNTGNILDVSRVFDDNLVASNTVPISSIIFRNESVNLFDEKISRCEDWLFWIQNLKNKSVYFDSKYVGNYVNVESSKTMVDYVEMVIGGYEIYQIVKEKKLNKGINLKLMKNKLVNALQIRFFCDETRANLVLKHSPVINTIVKMALATPCISVKIKNKLLSIKRDYIYSQN